MDATTDRQEMVRDMAMHIMAEMDKRGFTPEEQSRIAWFAYETARSMIKEPENEG